MSSHFQPVAQSFYSTWCLAHPRGSSFTLIPIYFFPLTDAELATPQAYLFRPPAREGSEREVLRLVCRHIGSRMHFKNVHTGGAVGTRELSDTQYALFMPLQDNYCCVTAYRITVWVHRVSIWRHKRGNVFTTPGMHCRETAIIFNRGTVALRGGRLSSTGE